MIARCAIGLEVHAQLLTRNKLFTQSLNLPSSPPNTLLSPFDLALPGSLPVLNFDCVEKALVAATVLKCRINDTSRFERKHYFYPDNPSGYQITQNRWPIASEGVLEFGDGQKSLINRIQLETDTGKSKRAGVHGFYDDVEEDAVGTVDLDFNRAGSPLIEIVFEPDITSPSDASLAVLSLRNLLRHVSVCDGKFELGSIRCDLNVSVWHGTKDEDIPEIGRLGNRVEVKNLNSLKSIVSAATYEFSRQSALLSSSPSVPITQETRTFCKKTSRTVPMRKKESTTDYRFLPDPDLPPLVLSSIPSLCIPTLQSNIPELPSAALSRLVEQYKLPKEVASVIISSPSYISFLDTAVETAEARSKKGSRKSTGKLAANLITNVLFALVKSNVDSGAEESDSVVGPATRVTGVDVGEVVGMLNEGVITKKMGKDIITLLHEGSYEGTMSVEEVVEEHGFKVENDGGALVEVSMRLGERRGEGGAKEERRRSAGTSYCATRHSCGSKPLRSSFRSSPLRFVLALLSLVTSTCN